MVKSKKLRISWSKREKDLKYHYPSKPDGMLLHAWISYHKSSLGLTLQEELEQRGYDITTLKFSIEKKDVV